MSSTEIFIVKKNRVVKHYKDVCGAMAGAMAIWNKLERKYLPSLPMDDFYIHMQKTLHRGETPYKSRLISLDTMDEIWDLQYSDKVSNEDKIMLLTTLDKVYIEYDFLPEVADIYENSSVGTAQTKKQAEVFRKIYENEKKILGVYVNQTSVQYWSDNLDSCGNGYYKIPTDFAGVRALFNENKNKES